MQRDYEQDRVKAQIEKLTTEHGQLQSTIVRTKRDEQFEVERIRRDYKARVTAMEERQEIILRELLNKKNELQRVEIRLREQSGSQTSAVTDDKERRLRRIS